MAQSVGPEHEARHSVPPQVYSLHFLVIGGLHTPAPSQYRTGVSTPAVQLAVAHSVVTPGGAPQASPLTPSHLAWHEPEPRHLVRVPWTAPATAWHLPSCPATSQAWHCPVQLVSQQ